MVDNAVHGSHFFEELLDQRLSLAEIGKRFGKHEATVGYWVKKHGLEAVNRAKHAAKGGLERGDLEQLVVDGRLAIAEIAGRSKATVRHWLGDTACKTQAPAGAPSRPGCDRARASGQAELVLECSRGTARPTHHGRPWVLQVPSDAGSRRSFVAGARSSRLWWLRLVGSVACVAIADVLRPSSFITWTRRARIRAVATRCAQHCRTAFRGAEVCAALLQLPRRGRGGRCKASVRCQWLSCFRGSPIRGGAMAARATVNR